MLRSKCEELRSEHARKDKQIDKRSFRVEGGYDFGRFAVPTETGASHSLRVESICRLRMHVVQ